MNQHTSQLDLQLNTQKRVRIDQEKVSQEDEGAPE